MLSFPDGRAALEQKRKERQRKTEEETSAQRRLKVQSLVDSKLSPSVVMKRLKASRIGPKPNIPATSGT